ncbi:MAG: hypothetical protein RJQ14_03745 [Marinoscillum sp.]
MRNADGWDFKRWDFKKKGNSMLGNPKLRDVQLDSSEFKQVMDFMEGQGFWSIDNDILNLKSKPDEDGRALMIEVLDGYTYEFQRITHGSHIFITANNPARLQEFVYSQQRQVFLDCHSKFYKYLTGID